MPLCIVLPMAPLKVGVGVIAGWILLIWVAIAFVRGQFHYVRPVLGRFLPLLLLLLPFPKERSVFTVDRAFVLLLIIEMLIVSRQTLATCPV